LTFEWVVPAAGLIIDHHDKALSAWDKASTALVGKKSQVVITGMAGSGKTVLFDHITGRAFRKNYLPPGKSQSVESGGHKAKGKRLRISVVPGQESNPRMEALRDLFGQKTRVDGVVHVVANGFIDVREEHARRVLLEDHDLKTTQRFRDYQFGKELEDLDATCDVIRAAFQHHDRPKWLIVAVNKVDLFHEELVQARERYSPSAQSSFSRRLAQLQQQLGTDHFRWEAVPVCSWPENFVWNGKTRHSRLNLGQRNYFLNHFTKQLEAHCEGR
jgi:hypothetical protein